CRQPGAVLDGWLELSAGTDWDRDPARHRRRRANRRHLPRARCSDPAAGRRHQSRRPMLQRRRRDRLFEVSRCDCRTRSRGADRIRARFPKIPRRVSGYSLDQLLPENGFHVARALVGSEGTCVTILEATVRLVPSPPARTLVVLGYGDIYQAADHVPEILAAR